MITQRSLEDCDWRLPLSPRYPVVFRRENLRLCANLPLEFFRNLFFLIALFAFPLSISQSKNFEAVNKFQNMPLTNQPQEATRSSKRCGEMKKTARRPCTLVVEQDFDNVSVLEDNDSVSLCTDRITTAKNALDKAFLETSTPKGSSCRWSSTGCSPKTADNAPFQELQHSQRSRSNVTRLRSDGLFLEKMKSTDEIKSSLTYCPNDCYSKKTLGWNEQFSRTYDRWDERQSGASQGIGNDRSTPDNCGELPVDDPQVFANDSYLSQQSRSEGHRKGPCSTSISMSCERVARRRNCRRVRQQVSDLSANREIIKRHRPPVAEIRFRGSSAPDLVKVSAGTA